MKKKTISKENKEEELLAEQKLILSEARYKKISESLTDYFYTVKINNGKAVETIHGETCLLITGYTSKDFAEDSHLWINMIPPEERDSVVSRFNRILEGEDQPPIEHRIICKDRKIRWVVDTTIPNYDLNGKLISYDGVIKDITERKDSEEKLRESEIKYREMVEQINDVIFETDLNGVFTYVSPAVHAIGNFLPSDLIGRSMKEFLDPSFQQKLEEQFQKVLSGVLESTEYKVITKNGDARWVRSSSRPILRDNHSIGLRGILTDITIQKLAEEAIRISEEQFRSTFEQAAVGMAHVTPEGKWLRVNNRLCEMLGYTKNEMLSIGFRNISHPDEHELDTMYLEKIISNELEGFSREKRYLKKDGSILWVNLSVSAHHSINGKPEYMISVIQDISDRKKAEAEKQTTYEKFINLSNEVPAFIAYLNANTLKYEYVNEVFVKSFNIPRDKIIGNHISEVIGQENFDFALDYLNQVRKGISTSYENLFNLAEGKRWLTVNYSPVFNSNGEVESITVLGNDITERKASEEIIRTSEEMFRHMFLYSALGMALVNPQFKFIRVNQALCKMFGYEENELINKSFQEITFPEDRPLGEKLVKQVLLRETETFQFEKRYIRKDGSLIWGMVSASLICDSENKPVHLVAQVQDINARKIVEEALKRSEEIFRRAFVVSPDSININRLSDGKYIQINQGFTRIMGYNEKEIVGRSSIEMNIWKNKEDREKLVEGLKNFGTVENLEAEFAAKDGTTRYGLMSATVIDLNNEKHILSITRDITDRKIVEAELEKYRNHLEELVKLRTEELDSANKELRIMIDKEKELELILRQSLEKEKELNEMKSRFISTTSHEFRTPLTSVLSSAELMQRYAEQWSDQKKNEHLERIKNSVSYLTNLLDDILTINKAESGSINFSPQLIDLKKLSEGCIEDASHLASDHHNIYLHFQLIHTEYYLDAKLMKFILNNLLSNAIKYSPDGGKVELNVSSMEGNLILEVKDEGIGIEKDDNEKVFGSFYRAKNAENISGTGLGLTIVKRAVELHHGEILVKSEAGKGTSFSVRIPIENKFSK